MASWTKETWILIGDVPFLPPVQPATFQNLNYLISALYYTLSSGPALWLMREINSSRFLQKQQRSQGTIPLNHSSSVFLCVISFTHLQWSPKLMNLRCHWCLKASTSLPRCHFVYKMSLFFCTSSNKPSHGSTEWSWAQTSLCHMPVVVNNIMAASDTWCVFEAGRNKAEPPSKKAAQTVMLAQSPFLFP